MTKKKIFFALVTIAVVIGIIASYFMFKPEQILLQGEVESNRVDVSARVQGRVSQLNFDVGDNVKQGDTLLTLVSPALMAQKNTAEAQLNVAIASRNNTYSTRPETIAAQNAALEKAQSDLKLAKQSYDRIHQLSMRGLASKQSYDEAYNSYQAALKARDGANANLELAVNGSSPEAKHVADSQVEQARAALAQVITDIEELNVTAPVSGQITARVAELGQLYNPGSPLYSIVDLSDIWFTFNIREDFIGTIKVGDTFNVNVPALNNKMLEVRITALNPLGQYANWKATKATGDFDLKTFEMRAKPIVPDSYLRPGMTVTAMWQPGSRN